MTKRLLFAFYAASAAFIWACLGLGVFWWATGRTTFDLWDLVMLPFLAVIAVNMCLAAYQLTRGPDSAGAG